MGNTFQFDFVNKHGPPTEPTNTQPVKYTCLVVPTMVKFKQQSQSRGATPINPTRTKKRKNQPPKLPPQTTRIFRKKA